jgi:hypothetical protein
VAAPVSRVWQLVTDPSTYDSWVDARVDRVVPPGCVHPGQTVELSTVLGRRWMIRIAVKSVDAEQHVLELDVHLPLGIINHERMTMVPLDEGHTHVSFG